MAAKDNPLSLNEAARRADTSEEAVRGWCRRLGIGEKIDGRWHVDPDKLQAVIEARRMMGRPKYGAGKIKRNRIAFRASDDLTKRLADEAELAGVDAAAVIHAALLDLLQSPSSAAAIEAACGDDAPAEPISIGAGRKPNGDDRQFGMTLRMSADLRLALRAAADQDTAKSKTVVSVHDVILKALKADLKRRDLAMLRVVA